MQIGRKRTRGNKVTGNGEHGNATGFDFCGAELVESRLILIEQKVERIPKAQRLLRAEFACELVVTQGRRFRNLLLRGECGGRAGHEAKDGSNLHGRNVTTKCEQLDHSSHVACDILR
jgi:hypothetical protein